MWFVVLSSHSVSEIYSGVVFLLSSDELDSYGTLRLKCGITPAGVNCEILSIHWNTSHTAEYFTYLMKPTFYQISDEVISEVILHQMS